MRAGLLQDQKKLTKFDVVRQHVAEEADLNNPDIVIDMDRLKVTEDLNLEVPKVGTFNMTEWSKKQLGAILGVTWDKWFDSKLVKANQVQEEIQRRFSKTKDSRKFRTRKFRPGAPGVPNCDGLIRGILSPTYHSIDDERIFDRLERKFKSQVSEFKFMKDHLNKHATWGNDHCQHYTMVGEPINLGPINRNTGNPDLRRIYDMAEKEGKLPDADWIYPGMHMRNSEVGYTAITIDEFSFRLICLNGAMISVGDSRLLYRQHRPIDDDVLDRQITDVFAKVPKRWEATMKNYHILAEIEVGDPREEIKKQLTKMEATKSFIDNSIKMYDLEPMPTMYGVLNAITRAAQDFSADMDKRYEAEALAGRLVASAPRLQIAA